MRRASRSYPHVETGFAGDNKTGCSVFVHGRLGVKPSVGGSTEDHMNDDTPGRSMDDRKGLMLRLIESLGRGAEARAGVGAIYRELEAIAPGSLDRAHARHTARRLGLPHTPDLGVLDWPEAPGEGHA
jgi:hypothetical protein